MTRKLGVVVAAAAIALVAAGCVSSDDTYNAMNSDRAAAGVSAVQRADDLTSIAQNWANHLRDANSFDHQDLGAVMAWLGLPYCAMGETLAKVPFDYTGAQVEAIWMNSAEHRAIVLDGRYGYVGIGIASDSAQTTTWVVADFGGGC
jgi:uncharacterized protein YkwD